MQLTREQAIAEHRKMWNWIADRIERCETVLKIPNLKIEYLTNNDIEIILGGCFLCEYADSRGGCKSCPLKPRNGINECLGGLYWECDLSHTWQEQAKLARQIANLPERRIS